MYIVVSQDKKAPTGVVIKNTDIDRQVGSTEVDDNSINEAKIKH